MWYKDYYVWDGVRLEWWWMRLTNYCLGVSGNYFFSFLGDDIESPTNKEGPNTKRLPFGRSEIPPTKVTWSWSVSNSVGIMSSIFRMTLFILKWHQLSRAFWNCVLHFNLFYLSTSSTRSVRADSAPYHRKIQALWSQATTQEIIHHAVLVSTLDNAMPCHITGYFKQSIHTPAT